MTLLEAARANRRTYGATAWALGAAAGLAALTFCGALAAGDTIRASLDAATGARLGPYDWTVAGNQRPFSTDLEDRLARDLGTVATSVIDLPALLGSGDHRLPSARVLGLTDGPGPEEAWLSTRGAALLDVGLDGEVLCQVAVPGFLPSEAPLGGLAPQTAVLRLRVTRIDDGWPARFSTRKDQEEPVTAVVHRETLAKRLDWVGRANLLLVRSGGRSFGDFQRSLDRVWTLGDAGYRLEALDDGRTELVADRVFLEDALVRRFEALVPPADRMPVYTWFADSLGKANYLFVGSGDTPFLPRQPGPGEVVITDWLAATTGARVGDTLPLGYRLPDARGALSLHGADYRVTAIVPVPDSAAARDLMPRFPGMAGAATCRDWDPGLALDLTLIGPREEAYWARYRGTPQAFLSLDEARARFVHPFGTLTALRVAGHDPASLARDLAAGFGPGASGFTVADARQEGRQSVARGVDFSGLFLGLNLLLMASALALALQVVDLALGRRRHEVTLYRNLGWPEARIRRLFVLETTLTALPGVALASLLGLGYDAALVAGLNTFWAGVTNTPLTLSLNLLWPPVSAAVVLAAQAALVAAKLTPGRRTGPRLRPPAGWTGIAVALPSLGAALVLPLVNGGFRLLAPVEAFFLSGFLALVGSLGLFHALLGTLGPLVLRPLRHHRSRAVRSSALLAAGLFLVLGIGAYLPPPTDGADPRSATGAFPWLARTTLPLTRADLDALAPWNPVGVRVRDGDDASCLNIRRSLNPPLWGVDPKALAGHFALAPGQGDGDPWPVLEGLRPDGAIPVLVDATVLTWGLGKAVGDRIPCRAEDGSVVDLVVAATLDDTLFQGALLLSETNFKRLFPSEAGYRLTLLGTMGDEEHRRTLVRQFRSRGLVLEAAADRMARLRGVEGGYLAIFLVLGALALALVGLGFALQTRRTALEAAADLEVLEHLGWPAARWRLYVSAEPMAAWLWGGATGTFAAWLALQGQASRTDWGPWWAAAALVLVTGALALGAAFVRFRRPAVEHGIVAP